MGEDREGRKGYLVTDSQDRDDIARDARWEKRLLYKALISFVVVVVVVIVRELLLW